MTDHTQGAAAPDCLAPLPPTPPAHTKVPAGAWDTHAHVIGGDAVHPFVPNRSYTPPAATVQDYVAMLDRVGLAHAVIVPISVHGTDNRLLLDALRQYPGRLRGVASIDGSEKPATLAAWRDAGICGVRVNELFEGGSTAALLERLAARCRPLGWHLDLALHAHRIRELLPMLAVLDLPLVIDHMGFCPAAQGVSHPDFQAVLQLLAQDNVWVKLSGAYRLSSGYSPYFDVGPFVQALYRTAPRRCIWAADWPHVALTDPQRMPQAGDLLDFVRSHLPSDDALADVLVHNPTRLYGVPSMAAEQSFNEAHP
ncbi:MAG TPA: amidohydrolase family protein [Ramlibacter sp.]|nr:amidohydrolase family protein [Ramlibacter sp.]